MRKSLGIVAMGVMGMAGAARGATVEEEVMTLAGDWQGAEVAPLGHPAGSLRLSLAPQVPGGGAVFAKATLGDDGTGLIGAQDFQILQSGGQSYAVAASDGTPEAAFAVEHAPFGGLRFHRLVRSAGAADGTLTVQAEEIVLGKAAADGTRELKVERGEKLCRDASGVTTVCGAAEARTYNVKR